MPDARDSMADLEKQGLKFNVKRTDFSGDFVGDNLGGQKKLGKKSNCGGKRERSDQGVKPTEDINACEDQGNSLISDSAEVQAVLHNFH